MSKIKKTKRTEELLPSRVEAVYSVKDDAIFITLWDCVSTTYHYHRVDAVLHDIKDAQKLHADLGEAIQYAVAPLLGDIGGEEK